jgi:protoheme IX farnesyltransferase
MALALTIFEAWLGRQNLFQHTPALLEAFHLGMALLIQALLIGVNIAAFTIVKRGSLPKRLKFPTVFGRWTILTAGTLFLVMLSGVYLAGTGSSQVCIAWPACGTLLPSSPAAWLEITHRLLTLVATLSVFGLLITAWRRQRSQEVMLSAATSVAVLFLGQVLIGALKVMRGSPLDLVGLHAADTVGLWAALIVLVISTGLAGRSSLEEETDSGEPISVRQRLGDLLVLTKPVIVLLLLVTTYAGMVVGAKAIPSLALTFWTLLGGALAAGGSSAINQYIDRDLDRQMQRTAKRPLAAGRMTPAEGLAFAIGLCLAAFFVMAGFVNLLAAVLSLAGMVYYVLIYSIFLKKATVQNIVIGGGAGAIPPMVGWAAATGSLGMPALFLFAIVFLWTPPHFWALALVRRKDYARAGVPMLPVVKGEQVTRQQIFIYTLELVGMTLLMPIFHMAGSLFLILAIALGGILIYSAWRVLRKGGNKTAYTMYRFSSMYLLFIFVALMLDALIRLKI